MAGLHPRLPDTPGHPPFGFGSNFRFPHLWSLDLFKSPFFHGCHVAAHLRWFHPWKQVNLLPKFETMVT